LAHNVNILNGLWYVHKGYALSYAPLAYQLLSGKTEIKTEKDLPVILTKYTTGVTSAASAKSDSGESYAAVVDIKTMILKFDDFWAGIRGTKSIGRILQALDNDPACVGIVLDIDSGGGQVYGTPLLYDVINNLSKPVVAYTDGMMCSAAYYLGAASDHIVANPRAEDLGSLGAYAGVLDFNGMFEKWGAKYHEVYATESTEKNHAYRELLEGNYEPYITQELDPIVTKFHEDMKASRPQLDSKVFKGGTWNGEQAVELGLADVTGTLADAVNKVFELHNANNSNLNTTTMSKNRPLLQSALGLDHPLEEMEGHSSLSVEMIDSLETVLSEKDTAVTAAEAARDAAITEKDAAISTTASTESAMDALIASKEIEVAANATPAEKLTAIENHINVLGKQDGDSHTNVGADGKENINGNAFVDAGASHNRIADELFNQK
tara:strand:- start:54916 stop:56226 length:1311 start_codon:yes stop_codon:yes gene_type:complete